MTLFYSAREAAQRLGVSVTTLYSYVSRGKLKALAGASHRERRYRSEEVDHLAGQLAAARSPSAATRRSLDFGRPVVPSELTLIEKGRLYYRGQLATRLAQSASLESVSALLWRCDENEAFPRRVSRAPRRPRAKSLRPSPTALELIARVLRARTSAPQPSNSTVVEMAHCGALVRTVAAALLRRAPSAEPIHCQCAEAWGLSLRQAEIVRMALVLCADHELNASTFTVRCVASTQADLHTSLVAGLAALSGPLHGGATDRVEDLLDATSGVRDVNAALRQRRDAKDRLPGFGHLLYPGGDVRASVLLQALGGPPGSLWRRIAIAGEALTGEKPSVDFALVAVRRALRLPRGAAFGLFALGRSVGWIAHAIEQQQSGHLIRPRAEYLGPRPSSPEI